MNKVTRPFYPLALLLILTASLYQWVIAATAGPLFTDTGQLLGSDTTYAVALADLDGDNDLDLVTANQNDNRIWLNDGTAK